MAKNKKHTPPSTDLLRRYVAGTLSPVEQYQLEKAALQNQQIDDTLEGLQAMKAVNIDEKAALEDLNQRLRQRVRKSERKLLPYYYASAAAVVLTVGLSWWLIQKEGAPEAESVTSAIALEKERPVLKPEAAPATIESQTPTLSATTTPARKPSLSRPSTTPQFQQSADAEKAQQIESSVPNLAFEEKKNEAATPPTASDAAQTQDAQQIVAAKPKMSTQSRVAPAAPAPVQSTQDLDTVRVVSAKTKQATQVINGAVAALPQGRAKKENVFALKGKVLDAVTQEPLPGVILSFEGRFKGATTDAEGKFILPNVQKNDKISISFVGFQTLQMTIKDSLIAPILLQVDQKALSEVVVTGYGKTKPVSIEASPKNGRKAYENYLKTSAASFIAQNPQAPRGRVVLHFSVNASGELSNFENKNKANPVLFEEAMRIIKSGDAWNPALKNGQPEVRKVRLVVRFE